MTRTGAYPLITALKRNSLDDGPGIRTTVFFKGCPLSCVWCQNPEAKSSRQELTYDERNCTGCSRCMDTCVNKAVSIGADGSYPIDRQKCLLCGECVRACRSEALRFAGTAYDAEELAQKLLKDEVFYRNSNGGVTFSGGEPTLHLDYLSTLAKKLKEHDIHLCLETCGFFDYGQFEEMLLPYLDLILFDIKIFNRETHRKYCGAYNDSILKNFKSLYLGKKVKVLPRIPLIPEITAIAQNLIAIRDFFRECGVEEIWLLPYNPLWLSKLSSIGVSSDYSCTEWMDSSEKDIVKEIFKEFKFRNF